MTHILDATSTDAVTNLWSRVEPFATRTPMQHDIWIKACFEVLYPGRAAFVIASERGVGAFAKLGGALPTLYLVGAEELAEPIEVVAPDEESAGELVSQLLAQRLPVRFGHHPYGTPFHTALLEQARTQGYVFEKRVPASPYIDLDASWREPETRFSSRRRSDFRRMLRRAEAAGAVDFEFHRPAPHEVAGLLDRAIDVERRGWKSRSGTALMDNAQQRAFFHRYGVLAAERGILRVNFMTIDGLSVAMQIAAETDDAYWLFKIGYDETYARSSPGMLMMLESIRRAAQADLGRVEFLGKSASWTDFWTKAGRPNCSLRYYPRSTLGYAAIARDSTVLGSRRLGDAASAALRGKRKKA